MDHLPFENLMPSSGVPSRMTGVRGSWVHWRWDSPPQDTPVPHVTFRRPSLCHCALPGDLGRHLPHRLPPPAGAGASSSASQELWTAGSTPGREDGSREARPPAPCPTPDSGSGPGLPYCPECPVSAWPCLGGARSRLTPGTPFAPRGRNDLRVRKGSPL